MAGVEALLAFSEIKCSVLWDFKGGMASTALLVVVFVFDLIAFALAVEQRRSTHYSSIVVTLENFQMLP